jgi:cell division septation protein DedD
MRRWFGITPAGAFGSSGTGPSLIIVIASVLTFCVAPPVHADAEADAALKRALALPPQDALRVLDSVSKAPSVEGWVRAQSLRYLGDHRFAKDDYKKSADFYQQASKFDDASIYRHLYALSLAMDGKVDAAREIWTKIAADKSDKMSAEAEFILKEFPPASQHPTASNKQPSDKQSIDKPSADKPPVSPNKQSGPFFTVQVGAFGSKDNADNLVKKLTGKYPDITVATTMTGDQTLHRVRVGTFSDRDEAIALAEKLTSEGMSARVVEK